MTPGIFAQRVLTYIENWDERLYALSIPQVDIPLTLRQAHALGSNLRHFSRWFVEGPPQPLDDVADLLEGAVRQFRDGAFVRLGSRSAKDCDFALSHGLRISTGRAALRMLTDGSERIAWDLRWALRNGYCPHIFLREWCAIPPWAEFRCFMKKRRLVGVSQYDLVNLGACPEIATYADAIFRAIKQFFEDFRVASHLDDVVFDVFAEPKTGGSFRIRLLELNPFFPKTDACLFQWDGEDDFDGSFRYVL